MTVTTRLRGLSVGAHACQWVLAIEKSGCDPISWLPSAPLRAAFSQKTPSDSGTMSTGRTVLGGSPSEIRPMRGDSWICRPRRSSRRRAAERRKASRGRRSLRAHRPRACRPYRQAPSLGWDLRRRSSSPGEGTGRMRTPFADPVIDAGSSRHLSASGGFTSRGLTARCGESDIARSEESTPRRCPECQERRRRARKQKGRAECSRRLAASGSWPVASG